MVDIKVNEWHESVVQGVHYKDNELVVHVLQNLVNTINNLDLDKKNRFLINFINFSLNNLSDIGKKYLENLHEAIATDNKISSLAEYKQFYWFLYKNCSKMVIENDLKEQLHMISYFVSKTTGKIKTYKSLYDSFKSYGIKYFKEATIFEEFEINDDIRPLIHISKGIRRAGSFIEIFRDIGKKVSENENKLYKKKDRTSEKSDNKLYVFKRFSSHYPSIGKKKSALGGGFYLRWKGKGIVVDPGYNFLQQFVGNGFGIWDIDCILVTHAHDDHTADIERIISYLNKSNKKNGENKTIPILGSMGVKKKYSYLKNNITVLKKNDENCYDSNSILNGLGIEVKIRTFDAFHHEKPINFKKNGTSVGIGITCMNHGSSITRIVFTGDTRYNSLLNEQYLSIEPNYMILNIGNIESVEYEYDKNHLGIFGATQIINNLTNNGIIPKLFVLDECGYEWNDYRIRVPNAISVLLKQVYANPNVETIKMLPSENKLVIDILKNKVRTEEKTFKSIDLITTSIQRSSD
ncbi:MAG: MBL fold metallo-hydrolase, partial [Candidatus Odinarchaeota archaeon]